MLSSWADQIRSAANKIEDAGGSGEAYRELMDLADHMETF